MKDRIVVKDLQNVDDGFTAMIYVDSESDLADIPKIVKDYRLTLGSHVFVAENSKLYNLKSDGSLTEA